MIAAWLLLIGLPKRPHEIGPRFTAVVEIYRQGVWNIDCSGTHVKRKARRSDRTGSLSTWSSGSYAITDSHGTRAYPFGKNAPLGYRPGKIVIGWVRASPVLRRADGRLFAASSSMPSATWGADYIAAFPDGSFFVARPYMRDGSDVVAKSVYSIVRQGKAVAFTKIGTGACQVENWQDGVLVSNNSEVDDALPDIGYGDLWFVHSDQREPARLSHRRRVSWAIGPTQKSGQTWVTALGFDGRWKKFNDYSDLFKLAPDGHLEPIIEMRGELTYYGLDRTHEWVIATRWHGLEMGAYDLVAINLRTKKEVPLLHGVSGAAIK